jgi:hypothetical protein
VGAQRVAADVRLTIRLLGCEVFHVDTDPDPEQLVDGGALVSAPIPAEPDEELALGFTGPRDRRTP